MTEPIPVRVTRYRCPHCGRSHSSKSRCTVHMGRCWQNPDAHGCKTCKHYGGWEGTEFPGDKAVEVCWADVDLSGRPECTNCVAGFVGDWDSGEKCPECGGNPDAVKPGPIVHCDRWERAV